MYLEEEPMVSSVAPCIVPPVPTPPVPTAPVPACIVPVSVAVILPDPCPNDEEIADTEVDECVVCRVYRANKIVIVDCGHTCVCIFCLQKVGECPMCRAKITKAIRFYSSG